MRRTLGSSAAAFTASSAERTTLPTAAPGLAEIPCATGLTFCRCFGSIWGMSRWLRLSGLTRLIAVFSSIRPSLTISTAIRTADGPGPLAGAGLEHVERAVLDRELDVLHLLVVRLELLADVEQLVVDLGHLLLELADRLGGPDARDDVLALGVDQVVAEEVVLAGVRVAGERHAGARVVPRVAEDHGLDVDGGPLQAGDPLDPAVLDGLVAHPAIEDGHDGLPELVLGVLRERSPTCFS